MAWLGYSGAVWIKLAQTYVNISCFRHFGVSHPGLDANWERARGIGRNCVDNVVAGSSDPARLDMTARLARLTPGQLDCLRLVDQHHSSKEIAARLGISSHTVDQRIRGALQTLGVERRAQAARLLALHDAEYQRLIHQAPYVETSADAAQSNGAVGIQIRHADRAGGDGPSGLNTEQGLADPRPLLQWPIATRNNPRNEMSVGQRLLWIVLIATGSAFSAGMYLAGLESLSRLLGK